MTIQEGIGKRIRSLREFNKLSQTELELKLVIKTKPLSQKLRQEK